MCKKYVTCHYCGKEVNIRKPIIGSLHICLTQEEMAQIDHTRYLMRQQQSCNFMGLGNLGQFINNMQQKQGKEV